MLVGTSANCRQNRLLGRSLEPGGPQAHHLRYLPPLWRVF